MLVAHSRKPGRGLRAHMILASQQLRHREFHDEALPAILAGSEHSK